MALSRMLRIALALHVAAMAVHGEDATFQMQVRAELEGATDRADLRFYFVATSDAPEGRLPLLIHADGFRSGVGQFTLTANNKGRLTAPRRFPLFVSLVLGSQVLETKKIEREQTEVIFRVSAKRAESRLAALRMTFLDPNTGLAVEEGEAPIVLLNIGHATHQFQRAKHGCVEFRRVRTGLCFLKVSGGRTGRFRMEVHVDEPRLFDLGKIELRPAADFGGIVEDDEGNPIRCKVVAIPAELPGLPALPPPLGLPESVRTDERGRFQLRGLRQGKHYVVAYSKNHAITGVRIDTSNPDGRQCKIRLVAAPSILLVPPALALDRSPIFLITEDGTPLYSPRVDEYRGIRIRLAPGRYSFDMIEPANQRSVPFEVSEETETVRLAPG